LPLAKGGQNTGLIRWRLCDLFERAVLRWQKLLIMQVVLVQPAGIVRRLIAITGLRPDQQSANHRARLSFEPWETKATSYGTGAFILANKGSGHLASANRLLSVLFCINWTVSGPTRWRSVFVAGSLVQWLRDAPGLLERFLETETLAWSIWIAAAADIPALSGLGALHWQPEARGDCSPVFQPDGVNRLRRTGYGASNG
jgi:glycerol kinase